LVTFWVIFCLKASKKFAFDEKIYIIGSVLNFQNLHP